MLEEFSGKQIDKTFQFFNRRRLNQWLVDSIPFETEPHLGRFMIIASLVAGRDVRVIDLSGDVLPRPYRPILHKMAHPALLPAHGFGWTDGETIYLPLSLIDMKGAEEQENLAILLIFFLSSQIKYGSLTIPAENMNLFESDQLLSDIYWIVENGRLSSLIFSVFPGISRKWEGIVAHLIKRRPGKSHLGVVEGQVEALLEKTITALLPDEMTSASSVESLSIAQTIKGKWIDEGMSIRKYRGMVPFSPWGRLVPGRIKSDIVGQVENVMTDLPSDKGAGEAKENDEKKGRYITKRESINEEDNEQGLALNIFDKIMSWARFVNVTRPFDDDPDEDSKKKADEMEELSTVQVKKTTSAFLDADLEKEDILVEEIAEEGEKTAANMFSYPEWDYKAGLYRKAYSTGFEAVAEELDGGFVAAVLKEKKGLIKEVKRKFESLAPGIRIEKRQLDGDSIDIDAAVEAMIDLRLGKQPDERLFKFHKRSERDISALFLVDLSMSTDAWVKERRVIDHEKEALIVLCEAMQSLRERYSIYGFSGQTRKKCSFLKIKGFDEDYSNPVRRRIEGLIPYHYTRMGPAIRHATSILKKEGSEVKLLFLLSDGKPNDVDHYEGKYGIEDTRMAIKEAERNGVVPFCLTVDSEAHEYLPALFGRGNYVVLSGVDKLARRLPDLYARIIRQL